MIKLLSERKLRLYKWMLFKKIVRNPMRIVTIYPDYARESMFQDTENSFMGFNFLASGFIVGHSNISIKI